MLNYCSLYSGSSGNSFFVQSDKTCILIDAGVSAKKIVSALSSFNVDISAIDGILITHEHIDHTKGLLTLSNKYKIPIYINKKTWESLNYMTTKIDIGTVNFFDLNKDFFVGDLKVFPFPIPHDAANPCGFNIYQNDKKISIATDIGHVSTALLENLKNSISIFLEANYSSELLKYSSYPYLLKKRISGNDGHLSNDDAGKAISVLYNYGLKNAILVHLSNENNFPDLAYQTVHNEISNYKDFNLCIAPRNMPSKMYKI